ncbi:TPA: NUDIX pyrophosphatase [Candidatus Bathyarchaeota archaeon]|nr:NUDIX pyrophosphatase [Candidatus Bathyarchaeota archaeon]
MKERRVVTCFLRSGGKILLVKRSRKVGSYPGRWAGISGYVERNPDEQALKEIKEETGLDESEVKLVRKGEPMEVLDERLGVKWLVHPYLFEVRAPSKIRLDWENVEMKWAFPKEVSNYPTVPKLKEALERVL